MKAAVIFMLLAFAATGFTQDQQNGTDASTAAPPAPPSSSEAPPPSSSGAPPPPTSVPPPPPTTTPPPPPTTTPPPPPTTAPPPPPTSTPRPRTTTTPAPAPEPAKFPDNLGDWFVQGPGQNNSCIMFSGAIQIHLKGPNGSEVVIDVPNPKENTGLVQVTGNCGSDNNTQTQDMQLLWYSKESGSTVERTNTLKFGFAKRENGEYGMSSVSFTVSPGINGSSSGTVSGTNLQAQLQRSLECRAEQQIGLSNDTMYLLTANMQFEAFRLPSTTENFVFSSAEKCDADQGLSTGAILVIAVVVIVGFIGLYYLVKFVLKKCKREGYQRLDAQS